MASDPPPLSFPPSLASTGHVRCPSVVTTVPVIRFSFLAFSTPPRSGCLACSRCAKRKEVSTLSALSCRLPPAGDFLGPGASGRPQHSFFSFLDIELVRAPSFIPPTLRPKPFFSGLQNLIPSWSIKHVTLDSPHSANVVYVPRPPFLTEFPRCTYSKSRFHPPQPTTLGLFYSVLSRSPVRRRRTFPGSSHWLLQY